MTKLTTLPVLLLTAATALIGVATPASAHTGTRHAARSLAAGTEKLKVPALDAASPAAVKLGSAADFAVLGASTVTSTGSTVVTGNLGLSAGTSVTGFGPGVITGSQQADTVGTDAAKADLSTAYTDAAGRTPTAVVPTDLGGTTLGAGVYTSAAGTFAVTGTLTLDGHGNPGAVFIFQSASTLVTASASTVRLVNGARSDHVFWQVGSSATLGTGSTLVGTVMAQASITATTGTAVDGALLARTAAVTLDTTTVSHSCPPLPKPTLAPSIDCVLTNRDGTFSAVLGYDANSTVAVPLGADNRITPAGLDGHQPTAFHSGAHRGAFVTGYAAAGAVISWTLHGTTVRTGATSTVCPPGTSMPSSGNGLGFIIALAVAALAGVALIRSARRRVSARLV